MNASDILNQRLANDKADLESAYKAEWARTNQMFGPVSNDPQREQARQQRLQAIVQHYSGQGQQLLQKYKKVQESHAEIDNMAKQGLLATDPETVKQKTLFSAGQYNTMFPEQKPNDPVKEYDELSGLLSNVRRDLNKYQVQGKQDTITNYTPVGPDIPRWGKPVVVPFTGHDVEVPGGGVQIVDKTVDENGKVTNSKPRMATTEELKHWAVLTNAEQMIASRQEQIMRSKPMAARFQTSALRSSRVTGVEGNTPLASQVSQSARDVNNQPPSQTPNMNPDKSASMPESANKAPVGSVLSRGGKKWTVTGYDTDGTPLVDEVK